MEHLFLLASRNKFRFETPRGSASVEDLWDLPLTGRNANLDDIAKDLHKQLKDAEGEISFVTPAVSRTTELQAMFDIVKFIIDTKLAERAVAKAAETKREQKNRILEILSTKKDQELVGKSTEELEALLATL